jgi:hypothetical protein
MNTDAPAPCAEPGCSRPAEFQNPTGLHCRYHALFLIGGCAFPVGEPRPEGWPPLDTSARGEVGHAAD